MIEGKRMAKKKATKKRRGRGRAKKTTKKKKKSTSRKRERRSFSLERKAEILGEIDAAGRGKKGSVLQKYGLYPAQVSQWRKRVGKKRASKRTTTRAASPRRRSKTRARRGRVARSIEKGSMIDLVKENNQLRVEVDSLRRQIGQVRRFVAMQRQLSEELLDLGLE